MKLETLLPLIGVIVGWSLKTTSDYLTQRKEDTKRYRVATFYVLRIYKAVMDYERGTRFFRQENPTIDKFEPWRAILEAKCCESIEVNADVTSKAVETLASVDPPLATDSTTRLRTCYTSRRICPVWRRMTKTGMRNFSTIKTTWLK